MPWLLWAMAAISLITAATTTSEVKRWPSAKNDGDYAATCSSRSPNIQRREGIRLAAGETRALASGIGK